MENNKPTYEELQQENDNLTNLLDSYKTIIDNTVDWEIFMLPTGEFSYCSPSCKRISGYDANEFTGNPNLFFEIIHPLDKELVNEHLYKKKHNIEIDNDLEFRIITKDGNVKWIEHFCRKAYDNTGKFVGYRSSNRDISKRKEIELQLEQTNKYLHDERQIFTQGNVVVFKWKHSENWPVEYVSPNVETVFGFTPNEMQSPEFIYSNFIFPEDLERVASEVAKFSSNKEGNFEHKPYRVIGKNGKIQWVSDYTIIVRNETGEITNYIGYLIDISELKLLELTLRDSNDRLSITLNSIGDGVIVTDENGLVTGMNPVAEKYCGWTYAEANGKILTEIFNIINAETRKPADNPVRMVIETGATVGLANHTILISKDGKEYQIADSAAPIKDKEGKIGGVILVFSDVTESYAAQKQIKESETKYRSIFQNSPSGIIILDENGIICEANAAISKTSGYSIEELIGSDVRQLTEPENVYSVDLNIKRILSGEQIEHEVISCRKDGSRCVLFLRETSITLPNRKLGILSISSDITAQKRANDLLRESEEKYRFIAENTTEVIVLLDLNLKFTYISPAVLRQRGYTVEEAMLLKLEEATTPETINHAYQLLAEELANEASGTADPNRRFSLELGQYCKDGSTIWIDVSLSFIRDADGKAIGIFAVSRDITERKQAEETLLKNEKKYRELSTLMRLMADNMPDMLWAKDLNMEYLFVNKAICTGLLNAKDTEEPLGKTDTFFAMRERNSQPDNPEWHTFGEICGDSDAITLEAMKPMHFDEFGNVKGKFLFLDVHKAPLYDSDGQLIGVVGSARDVTAAKDAENQLRKLSRAVEQSPASVFITDPEGTIEYVNPKFTEVSGYTSEEAIGQNPRILKSGEQPSEVYTELWKTISGGEEWKGELHNKKKNDELFWESVLISPIKNEKGELLNYLAVKEDITEWKRAKEDLIKAKEKAEENEKRLDAFINSIPDIVCYKDGKGNWLLANDADLDLFCLTGVDYFGKTDFELSEYTNEIHKNAFIACMASDEIAWNKRTISRGIEIIPTVNSGDKVFEVFKIPTFTPNGERRGLAVIGRDITKLHETQEHLIKAKEKAEESNRLKSAFLANMSHEIRTPMNGILGFAELLKEPDLKGERQLEYIEIIGKSGARMLNIINDIVDISKIESGTMEVYISDTDINKQMELVYKIFEHEAVSKMINISFNNSLPDKEAIIKTDSSKFYSILTNLVQNAIKYTEKGSIVFGYQKKDEYLEFYIKDTGIGIPQDRQESVFERFIQADIEDKMARQGAGLGLSITKAYVEMLDGKIWLESEVGKGSTFYFTLPYNTATVEKTTIKNVVSSKVAEHYVENLKILIAEDDKASEMFITIAVGTFGKEIINVQTGVEAVETCRNRSDIDLVLIDIQMPDLNGYEATRQIRLFNKDVVIIAQTAFGLSGDREKAIEAGCNDYISKPINKNELLSLIQKYFRKQEK